MSERAEALAQRFLEVNDAFIREVEGLSDAQWRTVCAGEDWPAGVLAHHIGSGTETIMAAIRTLASGGQVQSESGQVIADRNAEHADRYAGCTREQTAAYLRQTGTVAAGLVRGLTDEQLARRGTPWSALGERNVDWLAGFLVTHLKRHRDSMRTALSST